MRLLRILLPRCEASTRWMLVSAGASGALHAVTAIVIVSVFGAVSPHLIPPPHGRNSIQLSASVIVVEAIDVAEFEAPGVSFGRFEAPAPHQTIVSVPRPAVVHGSVQDPQTDFDSHLERLVSSRSHRNQTYHETPRLDQPVRIPRKQRPAHLPKPAVTTVASMLNAGQLDKVPATIHSPRPEYPAEALAARAEGRVVLRVELDRNGRVTRATVAKSSGHRNLDEAARRSVATWKFEPATRLGVRVATAIAVPVTFRIDRN